MTVTRERFEQGLTYAAYKEQMTRNRERLEETERTVQFDESELAFFRALPKPSYVLALAEDWCGDVINNLPLLGRLVEASGTLELRVFLRDQNLDLIDLYLKDGQFRSIPVFAFFDSAFRPIGHWIERPARISALMNARRQELFATDPALAGVDPATPPGELSEAARTRMMAFFGEFRAATRQESDHEVLRELHALLAGQPQSQAATQSVAPAQPTGVSRIEELRARAQRAPRTNTPVKVAITYCSVCGYEPQTLELAGTLMREFVYDLASIELIPWRDGAFDVTIDGELVHSMGRDNGFPEPAVIVRAVRERLGVEQA